jgi:uncharacterized membrane protein
MNSNKLTTKLNKLSPHILFVFLAAFFGLLTLIITPPFQVPDEINHFYRAYQISEGNFIPIKQDKRIGGNLPASLTKITEPFIGLSWNLHAKTNSKTIAEQFKTPLNPKERRFLDFPNTGMYSPVSYFPQSIEIFVLRNFNLPPLYIFYGTRLFTLAFWTVILFWAIKIIPFYKWFFTLIALLPMSLFINMSLSADVTTNLLSFLLIAYILKLAYSDLFVTTQSFIFICILAILLASAKLVYSPILFLYLLIPQKKFYSKKTYYTQLIILFFISSGTLLFWTKIMNSLYLPYSEYNVNFRDNVTLIKCADMHEQFQYITHHGFYIWHVFTNSMRQSFDMYFQGYIGTFGWLDTKLPLWFIYFSYATLFVIAFSDDNKNINLKHKHKLVIIASLIVITSLILLSQHLTWDCVGGDIISTIQGRYFIPAFPLLFLLLYNSTFHYPQMAKIIVIIFTIFSLSLTIKTLYIRYYVIPKFESVFIRCDAENITEDNRFKTNVESVMLDNAGNRTNEKARSGNYSVKLTSQNPFGFTYRIFGGGLGDILHAEVWRFGKSGSIVFSGNSGKDFYVTSAIPVENDTTGWHKLELNYTISKEISGREIGIYLYNSSGDSVYFDDLMVEYKKYRNQ